MNIRIRLQAKAKPHKEGTQRNPLLIESNQSDISKTQDQDQYCHKDPMSALLQVSATSQSQQKSLLPLKPTGDLKGFLRGQLLG